MNRRVHRIGADRTFEKLVNTGGGRKQTRSSIRVTVITVMLRNGCVGMAILVDLFVICDIYGWSTVHAIQIHQKGENFINLRSRGRSNPMDWNANESGQPSWSVDFEEREMLFFIEREREGESCRQMNRQRWFEIGRSRLFRKGDCVEYRENVIWETLIYMSGNNHLIIISSYSSMIFFLCFN